ncbi:hypothetical protein [Microbacterium dauci]|uniref:Bacteriophage HK97-gp10, tail-component n=1 Tax=Microbacterium dauci TaxID=3048008 RepID=A0ABT6ZC09_9MICO|nr:hypothetical protein [Microbacterium sp. LX3-4]MDJ1113235.1 hypothetical protein [Microbacterium sp. LX3-4]
MKMHVPILSAAEQGARDGVRKAVREILKRSNDLAPKDDEDLVKSGGIRMDDLTGQASYTAPHALWQHENLDYEHADGGQAKFLETAALQVDVEAMIAAGIAEALRE